MSVNRDVRVWLGVTSLAAALLVFPGCRKKPQPAPQPDLTTSTVTAPAPVTTDVSPRPSPPVSDPRPDPLSGELEGANRHAYEQGLLGDIYFDFDRADLTEQARSRLARNAEFLRSRPEFTVIIEGHCDERGTNEYNLALGERRANAAREYLVSLGVSAARLRTVSYGEERPQCQQSNESCWALNRRAHFVLSGRVSQN
jgi:peptidoglycan-associated lipoprotein